MGRKRARLSQDLGSFSFYVDEPDDHDDVSYTHISYEGDSTGLRHATHRILLPPSPTRTQNRPEADEDHVIWCDEISTEGANDASDPLEILPDPGNFGDLDVAYIEHLALLELNEPKKRNRTAAVSSGGSYTQSLHYSQPHRMSHYLCGYPFGSNICSSSSDARAVGVLSLAAQAASLRPLCTAALTATTKVSTARHAWLLLIAGHHSTELR